MITKERLEHIRANLEPGGFYSEWACDLEVADMARELLAELDRLMAFYQIEPAV